MNVSPPIPWRDVPTGATALIDDTPRRVLDIYAAVPSDWRIVLLEGCLPAQYYGADTVCLVLLDDADAAANLTAAGLTIEPIENGASS